MKTQSPAEGWEERAQEKETCLALTGLRAAERKTRGGCRKQYHAIPGQGKGGKIVFPAPQQMPAVANF